MRAIRGFLGRLAAGFILLLCCFMIGEFLVRIFLRSHQIYDIEMVRYSLEFKKDSPDPLIGRVHKPNVTAKLMGVQVRTNSDGLRDREFPVPRGPKARIIFLGDSLTLGWGVEEADIFKNLLEEKLERIRPTEIINFGTCNYNTEQEVHLFLQKGLKYKPDMVVVFYSINDVEITPQKTRLWFLGYSRLIALYWSRFHILSERSHPSKSYKAYYSGLYRKDQPGLLRAQEAFLLLRDVCRKNHIDLRVVLLPELHELRHYPFKEEYRLMTDFLNGHGIACLDLAPYFSGVKNPQELWVAFDDAHFNQKAHKMIADYAFDFIKEFDRKESR